MQRAVVDEVPTEGVGTMADAPRVFLSYSHDSDEHAARVLDLANALRRDGRLKGVERTTGRVGGYSKGGT